MLRAFQSVEPIELCLPVVAYEHSSSWGKHRSAGRAARPPEVGQKVRWTAWAVV